MRQLLGSRWTARAAATLVAGAGLALLLGPAWHRLSVGRAWRAAEEAFERGEHARAAGLYQALAEEYPQDARAPRALYQAATIHYLFLRRERDAVPLLRDLARRAPQPEWSRRAQLLLGELFEQRQGDCRQAIVEYQRFINLQPEGEGNDEAQLAVARCYFTLGDFEQARGEYEALLENYPASPLRARARAGLGASHLARGRPAQAAEHYRRALEETGDAVLAAEAGFGLASALEEAGDLPGALRQLEAVRPGHPNRALVEQRIGRVRERLAQQRGPAGQEGGP